MKVWALALVALLIGAGAVTASLLISRPDPTRDARDVTKPVAPEPAFTVIDGTDGAPASPTPTPSSSPRLVPVGEQEEASTPTRNSGRERVSVQSGEIEESSTDQELEEEEAERELEEEEARQKAKDDREKQRARNRDADD